ncbi:MAG TPA: N-acyl homoserine lactonase family protein [Candidatus Tectomicrobia bacterium]|nr:N-acyl homoserine lactonase family protein [Candidatus Tectomicrobia bacterium]
MPAIPEYEIYAMKYAERQADLSTFMLGVEPGRETITIDYFVWLLEGGSEPIVVDTGFTPQIAEARQRKYFTTPADQLRKVGVHPGDVKKVLISHLHWDHFGGFGYFPNATFYLQIKEYQYWTGPVMRFRAAQGLVEANDMAELVRLNMQGRVHFVDGVEEVAPGLALHYVGGHTAGIQVARVNTKKGQAVVASDASHLFRNVEENTPANLITNLPEMFSAFDAIRELASGPDLWLPGHDPAVLQRFPTQGADIAYLK